MCKSINLLEAKPRLFPNLDYKVAIILQSNLVVTKLIMNSVMWNFNFLEIHYQTKNIKLPFMVTLYFIV